jgi:hypothetical protein
MIANRQSPAYAAKDGQPIAHLNLLGGREKQNFEHLRETKDLAVAGPPKKACGSSIAQGGWPTNFERLRNKGLIDVIVRTGGTGPALRGDQPQG